MNSRVRGLALILFLSVAAPIAPGAARADEGAYLIRRFHTDLAVQADGLVRVEERLEVDFTEPRHGIYRTVPVRYTDPKGYAYSFGFRLLDVHDENGATYKTHVRHQGRYINIRIGDADRTVSGRTVYVIRYEVRNALAHFPNSDELYWNATGNEWRTPIEAASATVRLPAALPADSLQAAAYTGVFGSTERNVRIAHPGPGVVHFEALAPLAPLEGLTVAVSWPPGYVRVPGTVDKVRGFFGNNWILLAPLLTLAFLWRRYLRHGRDPRGAAAVMVRYEPPPGVTAGGVGTVVDEQVDLRDITATVVDLAVRGYLTIREEEKESLFGLTTRRTTVFERKLESAVAGLLPHEQKVLDGIFESGDVVDVDDLKQKFYRHIPAIRDALYERMVEKGYFSGKPASVRQRYAGFGFLAGLVTFGLGMFWASTRGGIMPNAIGVPVLSGLLTAVLFFAFAPAMPRRTKAGVELRNWALGFEEFVSRVEKERIEADRQRNVFETLLPYAMALGVAAAWARKFEGIYAAGSGPAWYVGPQFGSGFSTRGFEQSLSGAMTRAGQGMTAAPRSSGSSGAGGGGSSGGGGGGGGGGSW
jgi:hypothetical protein